MGVSDFFVLPENRGKRFFVYYVLWILVGTLVFAYAPWSHTSGLIYGYHSAINVGYSIGWGYPPQFDGPELLFSCAYVLFGAGFVSLALGVFADGAMKDRDEWYTKLMKQKEYEEEMQGLNKDGSLSKKIELFYRQYYDTIVPVVTWVVWLFFMMLHGKYGIGWSWYTTLYFGLTSCSTGGMVGIPGPDEPFGPAKDYSFLLHAFLTSIGVPMMAMAMGALGKLSLTLGGDDELQKTTETVSEPILAEELEFLQRFGLEDGDGKIERGEYMILCMVRMGIDVQLLEFITKRFEELDADNSGSLSIAEVTGGKFFQDANGGISKIHLNHLSNEEIQRIMDENSISKKKGSDDKYDLPLEATYDESKSISEDTKSSEQEDPKDRRDSEEHEDFSLAQF